MLLEKQLNIRVVIICEEYKKAIEQIIAENRIWQDATNIYIKAWK